MVSNKVQLDQILQVVKLVLTFIKFATDYINTQLGEFYSTRLYAVIFTTLTFISTPVT
jgi:hypothetical protein